MSRRLDGVNEELDVLMRVQKKLGMHADLAAVASAVEDFQAVLVFGNASQKTKATLQVIDAYLKFEGGE